MPLVFTQNQNFIVYLMFLNGLVFLGLNFIAYSIVFPGPKGSKRLGYLLIVAVLVALMVTQEYHLLVQMDFPASPARNILLGGFILPVFLVSLVYYRVQRARIGK